MRPADRQKLSTSAPPDPLPGGRGDGAAGGSFFTVHAMMFLSGAITAIAVLMIFFGGH